MKSVLTLIAPAAGELSANTIEDVIEQLHHLGASIHGHDWLADREACDVMFSGAEHASCITVLRDLFSDTPLDMVIQPLEGRRKKLLLADMDSTIVTTETLDELAEYAGLKEQISKITERAMNGEILFRDALRERVGMLAGLDGETLAKTMDRVIYSPGARPLVRTMSADGAYTALASGGFRYFTGRVKQALGFDFEIGNEIEIIDGKLTGEIVGEIVTKAAKRETLISLAQQQGIDISETMTVGDGANDLPMLQLAGTGVAYHAHPIVIARVRHRIDHAGLDALLFLQGYRRDEFVG